MTQKKVYTTFFKEKAKEWLKFGYMDLTSEEDRILLLRETRKLPLEVLQGFNGVFSEILSKLREFDTLLHYLEGGYSLREEDLNYLLNVHTFPDYGFSDYSFDPDFESNWQKNRPYLEDAFYRQLNEIFTLIEGGLGVKTRCKLSTRTIPMLIAQFENTKFWLEKHIERQDAARENSKSRTLGRGLG